MTLFTDSQLALLVTLGVSTRGNPRDSVVKSYLRCKDREGQAALLNAAEISYRVSQDPDDPEVLVLIGCWPCPCEIKEHEGEVARWRK